MRIFADENLMCSTLFGYSILCKDESVKFIIRIPDMTFGFLIGSQLAEFGEFNGNFKCAPIKKL